MRRDECSFISLFEVFYLPTWINHFSVLSSSSSSRCGWPWLLRWVSLFELTPIVNKENGFYCFFFFGFISFLIVWCIYILQMYCQCRTMVVGLHAIKAHQPPQYHALQGMGSSPFPLFNIWSRCGEQDMIEEFPHSLIHCFFLPVCYSVCALLHLTTSSALHYGSWLRTDDFYIIIMNTFPWCWLCNFYFFTKF